ncbi:MAG: 50S ribosomal protein L31 [Candidatus Magasanikbacteria bacterium RIFOXYC2_FULL_40_16]|uniref:50S ribosomal protein L31 n=3 Tax=Candidatus Magasanikiibacteriota TaxID=1752731 RepID=A0A1F6NEF3_9BACT|nr:MAG: 50S ribosomal protein L31 [Candidatus Magasanikbacteria bacterium RIFOXYB1_FULL_40_15]OGH85979.1 MAG: 50S ribosomal protein L31 [Candidatus Magasanikbacteria bacterium RIFOXYB2_FULL_40_13]OGH87102.1 MAG: 50S ribosomal protein L31 [Candidatus Magasanikbacteria bacterium RIFOXYA1_FULL_40_8]OGH89986.1 MAG: 50S ribosomal protein L31 [Candidatus Magasanikbacteria bacterium RIFOXYC2_FULL_40_16]
MKKEIHPISKPTLFVDTSCGIEFFADSTVKSDETRTVNGVEYQVFNVEISSASHPFYTGKQILVDTARRVEKFHEKVAKTEAAAKIRKGKKAKKAKTLAKTKTETKKKTEKKEK